MDMDGIIQREQPQQPEKPARQATSAAVRGQMQVPPEQAETFEKVVAAGRKLLYSEQLAPDIQETLASDAPMGEKLGGGVVSLLAILMTKTNGAIPPQLLIPAGVALVTEAGDMLEEAGAEVSDNDVAEGVAVMVETLLQRAGVSLDQVPQLLQQGGAPAQEAVPPAAAEAPQPPQEV